MSDDPTVDTTGAQPPADPQAGAQPQDPPNDPPADPPQEPQDPPAASWRDNIADEKLKSFVDKFTTEEDLAKTALEFRQKLSNAISLPGKNATDEEVAEFRKKLGVPESPDGYKYDVPELPEEVDQGELEEQMGVFKQAMHAAGAPPETVTAAAEFFYGLVKSAYEKEESEAIASQEAGEKALKEEWGAEYDQNLEFAKRAARQFGGEDFTDFLNTKVGNQRIGDHPIFNKVFATIGRRMGEGGLQTAMSDDEKQTTEQKLDELTQQAHAAREKGDSSTADRLFKERDTLSKRFYGDAA